MSYHLPVTLTLQSLKAATICSGENGVSACFRYFCGGLTLPNHPPNIRTGTPVHSLQRQPTFILVEDMCLLRSIRKREHRYEAHSDRGETLDEEKEAPVLDGSVCMLHAECNEPTEGTRDGSEAEVAREAEADFLAGVEQR